MFVLGIKLSKSERNRILVVVGVILLNIPLIFSSTINHSVSLYEESKLGEGMLIREYEAYNEGFWVRENFDEGARRSSRRIISVPALRADVFFSTFTKFDDVLNNFFDRLFLDNCSVMLC